MIVEQVQWRSTDIERPDNNRDVLVWTTGKRPLVFAAFFEHGKWNLAGAGILINGDPSHWAEMPKGPMP